MLGKVIVSGLSLILVVGIALAIAATINKSNASNGGTEDVSPKMKAVSAICSTTDYQDECKTTLDHVARNTSSNDPKDYAEAAILATIGEITKGYNLSDSLIVEASTNASIKMSVEDCKDLLQFAIDELQASYSAVGESDLHTDSDRVADIKNWLSAVISYQQSCLDGLGEFDPQLKQRMQDGLDVAGKLTSNALAIVTAVSNILDNYRLQLKVIMPNHHLLESTF